MERARGLYERAIDHINNLSPKLFIEFAKFEVRQREIDRARAIYKIALQKFPPEDNPGLFNSFAQFEKSHGDPSTIDYFVFFKRRKFYEDKLKEAPMDYDTWFELVNLLQNSDATTEKIKETFESAVSQIPIIEEKRYWRRYVYLWLFYSLFCEKNLKDIQLARSILNRCLDIIPHSKFTFAKIWNELAEAHLRELDVPSARKTFGKAIGVSNGSSNSIFKKYIEMEMQLREFDRVRTIYQKWLEYTPSSSAIWLKWAELEALLDDKERARAIFNLAVDEPEMDLPELVWKAYIDFEYNNEEYSKVRCLYESLLERTEHLKVWISYVNFEASQNELEKARAIFERANKSLSGYPAERMLLFEAWLELEDTYGDEDTVKAITARQPKKIKKKRQASTGGWEEFYDYIFPDDEASKPSLKLLELAHAWKSQQQAQAKQQ
jgi:crooked neck